MLKDFSEDIIMNISSFLLGEPDFFKIKHSNTLKTLQRKFVKSKYQTPISYLSFGVFPSWRWYIRPPRFTTDRRVITHYLKNQSQQVKFLIDNPDYYNDGGILREVKFKKRSRIFEEAPRHQKRGLYSNSDDFNMQ